MNDINENRVITLAYLHCYGWIIVLIAGMILWAERFEVALIVGSTVNLIWSVVGYHCKWRHIYCSTQIPTHQPLTPHSVFWHKVDKSDLYGSPMIMMALGFVMILAKIMGW